MALTSIKQILADADLASPGEFKEWTKEWRTAAENGSEEPLLGFFAREKGLTEETFLERLAEAMELRFVEPAELNPSNEARKRVTTKVAFQHFVLPIEAENGTLEVAVCDPFDSAMINAVQYNAGGTVKLALATRSEIEKALKNITALAPRPSRNWRMTRKIRLISFLMPTSEITEGDQDASVIKFVNQVIWEAYKDRATDIHFEPAEDECIRYRVDGILHQTPMPPQLKRYQSSLISRIKVMSGMDIAEKRLPQDGRINVRIKGEELDIRVSTVPTVYGESVSLRLLTRGNIFRASKSWASTPRMRRCCAN